MVIKAIGAHVEFRLDWQHNFNLVFREKNCKNLKPNNVNFWTIPDSSFLKTLKPKNYFCQPGKERLQCDLVSVAWDVT